MNEREFWMKAYLAAFNGFMNAIANNVVFAEANGRALPSSIENITETSAQIADASLEQFRKTSW